MNGDQQMEFLGKAVDKIVADVAKVDPILSKAIRDYFGVTPSGEVPPGLVAFGDSLRAITGLGEKGKLDLDKLQPEGILLAVIKTNLMNKQPVAPSGNETVYEFLLRDDDKQIKEIQRLCSNVATAFSQRTEGGKPIPEDRYQERRQVANLLRALLLRGSTDVRDSLYGSVTFEVEKTAGTNPFGSVLDSLRDVVFEYFDKFKSPSIVKDSDADQQSYFLRQYTAYYQKSSDDYKKEMANIRQRADKLDKQLDQQKQELLQKLRKSCGEIVLHDGRRVLYVEPGQTYDEAKKKFQECITY